MIAEDIPIKTQGLQAGAKKFSLVLWTEDFSSLT